MKNNWLESNWFHSFDTNKENLQKIARTMHNNAVSAMAIEPSWNLILSPLSISNGNLTELESDLAALLDIWIDVRRRFFNNDLKKLAQYLGYEDTIINHLLQYPNVPSSNVYCRWDIMFTQEGPKILELNIGSNTGGGNIDALGPAYSKLVHNNTISFDKKCFLENAVYTTEHWARGMKKTLSSIPENKALAIIEDDSCFLEYENTLKKLGDALSNITDRKIIVTRSSDITVESEGISSGGNMVGALYSFFTIEDVLANEDMYLPIMNAIYKNRLKHIMGFEYIPYGNKIVSAILSENSASPVFNEKEGSSGIVVESLKFMYY